MRLKHLALVLPTGLIALMGCGSGSALLNSPEAPGDAARVQAAAARRPSIALSRPTLSPKRVASAGGSVLVGTTVTLKNLTTGDVTAVVTAVDSRKNVVATQVMTAGERNVWKTIDPGLALPPNYGAKAVTYTIHIAVVSSATPSLKKNLKVGAVSVDRTKIDPNLPPPPPF